MEIKKFRGTDNFYSDRDCIIDCPHVDAPLIISFSFAFWDKPCEFDFLGRLKKIQELQDAPINMIFLRDRKSLWYHHGVEGFGNNVLEVAELLKIEINRLRPNMIVTIGQSMGAYAALMFGCLLNVDKVIAFAPLSFLNAEKLKHFGDTRYYQALIKLDDLDEDKKFFDIVGLFEKLKPKSKAHIIFGTKVVSENEAVHLDAMHALRLQDIPQCETRVFDQADHLVVKYLSDSHGMDDLLMELIFDHPTSRSECSKSIEYEWYKWIFDNYLSGVKVATLIEVAEKSGAENHTEIVRELNRVENNPYILAAMELKKTLKKREWLLDTCDQLAALDERYSKKVEVRRAPPFNIFIREYYSKHIPVVLTHGIDHWPALEKWNPGYFKNHFAVKKIEVQFGRSQDSKYEQNAVKYKKSMTMGSFCDLVERGDSSNDFYMTANNNSASLEELAGLFDDVGDFGTGYRDLKNIKSRSHLWFGPKGTITQLHHDLTNNMLVQIFGRKKVVLIPAFQVPNIYNTNHVYSSVSFPDVDLKQFPAFRNVTPVEVLLHPGDALFIPIGWWHYVESLDASISISFTNFNARNDFFVGFQK